MVCNSVGRRIHRRQQTLSLGLDQYGMANENIILASQDRARGERSRCEDREGVRVEGIEFDAGTCVWGASF